MKISRRTFLKILAAGTGGAAALLLSPLPWQGVGRFVRTNQSGPVPLHKGKEELRQTVISHTNNLIPVEVRLVDGVARQLRPLDSGSHPLGGRGIESLAAAEIQNLARPSRITKPIMRKNGILHEVEWSEALNLLQKKLSAAGNSIACVTGEPESVGAALLQDFLEKLGSRIFFAAPAQRSTLAQALRLLGLGYEPGYDITESSCTLSVGADWLESWGPSYYWRNKIFENYPPTEKNSLLIDRSEPYPHHIYCGGYKNATARYVDTWLRLKPGGEELFLLALGQSLLTYNFLSARPNAPGNEYFEIFNKIFTDYAADKIGPEIGISPANINQIAERLAHASRPLVITGSALGVEQSPALHMLGFCLNLMLGSCFRQGGLYLLPSLMPSATNPDFTGWLADIGEKNEAGPNLIFVHECNPVYTLPSKGNELAHGNLHAKDIFKSIPFKVALAVYENETTAACDLVLPISASLERWEQIYAPLGARGYFSIEPPAVLPPPNIPGVASLLSALTGSSFSSLDFSKPHPHEISIFERSCKKIPVAPAKAQNATELLVYPNDSSSSYLPSVHLLKEILCDKKNLLVGAYHSAKQIPGLKLVPLSFNEHLNFSMGLSTFRACTLFNDACDKNRAIAWLNPAEAKRQNLAPGVKITITAPGQEVKAVVAVGWAIAEGCLGLYAGFGHEEGDQFSKGFGENLFKLYQLVKGPEPGCVYYRQMPVTLKKDL